MRAHIAAVKTVVATQLTAYSFRAPANPAYPYAIVELGSGDPDETDLTGAADWRLNMRIKIVAETGEAALHFAGAVREALCPGTRPRKLTVAGRSAQLAWSRHEVDYTDPDIRIPTTNTSPALSVDSYWLHSTPAP